MRVVSVPGPVEREAISLFKSVVRAGGTRLRAAGRGILLMAPARDVPVVTGFEGPALTAEEVHGVVGVGVVEVAIIVVDVDPGVESPRLLFRGSLVAWVEGGRAGASFAMAKTTAPQNPLMVYLSETVSPVRCR